MREVLRPGSATNPSTTEPPSLGGAAPFPFLVGRCRARTALLRAMLDSHPDMAVPPESHVLVRLGRNRRRYEQGGRFDLELFRTNTQKIWTRKWGLTTEELDRALSSAGPTTVPD